MLLFAAIRTFSFEQTFISSVEGSLPQVEVCVLLSSELSANFTIQPVNITIIAAPDSTGTLNGNNRSDDEDKNNDNFVIITITMQEQYITITIIIVPY